MVMKKLISACVALPLLFSLSTASANQSDQPDEYDEAMGVFTSFMHGCIEEIASHEGVGISQQEKEIVNGMINAVAFYLREAITIKQMTPAAFETCIDEVIAQGCEDLALTEPSPPESCQGIMHEPVMGD